MATVPTHPCSHRPEASKKSGLHLETPGFLPVLIASRLLLATQLHDNHRGRRREPKGTRQETGH